MINIVHYLKNGLTASFHLKPNGSNFRKKCKSHNTIKRLAKLKIGPYWATNGYSVFCPLSLVTGFQRGYMDGRTRSRHQGVQGPCIRHPVDDHPSQVQCFESYPGVWGQLVEVPKGLNPFVDLFYLSWIIGSTINIGCLLHDCQ